MVASSLCAPATGNMTNQGISVWDFLSIPLLFDSAKVCYNHIVKIS